MDLQENSIIARTITIGSEVFNVSEGKTLKIETSPSGEEIFNSSVPQGKKWIVAVHLKIEEIDT